MGIFSRIFGTGNAVSEFKFKPKQQTCIFDALGWVEYNQKSGAPPSPRDNFECLKAIAGFAEREGLHAVVLFAGRPLREAADGATYKNVKVRYADNPKSRIKTALRLLNGANSLLITSDPELEQAASQKGADCMRISTLKKALDNRDTRDGRNNRDNRRSRHPRRQPGGENQKGNVTPAREDSEPSAAKNNGDSQTNGNIQNKEILDLIDPI